MQTNEVYLWFEANFLKMVSQIQWSCNFIWLYREKLDQYM